MPLPAGRAAVAGRAARPGALDAVDVVGEAETVAEAVAVARSLQPDVVLLDVHLPDGGGQAVLAGVGGDAPSTRFLALSVSDAAEDVIGVIRAGARGYVTKTISGADLADAVRRVAQGDAVFSPRLAGCWTPSRHPTRRWSTRSSTCSPPGSARFCGRTAAS